MVTSYTTWGESGGVGKTTFAMNLAAAHSRNGYKTLAIDLDTQDGGLTDHAGFLNEKQTTDANNLSNHMIRRSSGDIKDIILTHPQDRFDIIPTHDSMRKLADKLATAEEYWADQDPLTPEHALREVITRNGLHEQYDVIIVDPPAKPSIELQNALYAAPNILSPVEVSPKGRTSIDGILAERNTLEHNLDIDIGIFGIVLNDVTQSTTLSEEIYESIRNAQKMSFAPVEIRHRESLLEGAWSEQMSAFSFAERKKDRLYSRERETLQQFQYLANIITGDIDPSETDAEELGEVVTRPSEHRIAEQFKQNDAPGEVQA